MEQAGPEPDQDRTAAVHAGDQPEDEAAGEIRRDVDRDGGRLWAGGAKAVSIDDGSG